MELDLGYIRDLLFEIERNDNYEFMVTKSLHGDSNEKFTYIKILVDMKFLKIERCYIRLTKKGKKFTNANQDKKRWEEKVANAKKIIDKNVTANNLKRFIDFLSSTGFGTSNEKE